MTPYTPPTKHPITSPLIVLSALLALDCATTRPERSTENALRSGLPLPDTTTTPSNEGSFVDAAATSTQHGTGASESEVLVPTTRDAELSAHPWNPIDPTAHRPRVDMTSERTDPYASPPEDLVCHTANDCIFASTTCTCSGGGVGWGTLMNRAAARRLLAQRPEVICPGVYVCREPRPVPVCDHGRCRANTRPSGSGAPM